MGPFLDDVLVIGANGFVGRHLVNAAGLVANRVACATRRESNPQWVPESNLEHVVLDDSSAFDELRVGAKPDMAIVMLPQLANGSIDWLLDRIDGPRWIVFSSAQLDAGVSAPGHEASLARETVALERGATVLRPTMIFGRGGDQNITPLIRQVARTRIPMQIGDGGQLLQPVHVDDLVDLVLRIAAQGGETGVHPVGGERIPSSELLELICELLGVRTPVVSVPLGLLRRAEVLAPLVGRRRDQVRRLTDDKIVDDLATRERFDWAPQPLAHRLEQAVAAAGFGPTTSVEVPGPAVLR